MSPAAVRNERRRCRRPGGVVAAGVPRHGIDQHALLRWNKGLGGNGGLRRNEGPGWDSGLRGDLQGFLRGCLNRIDVSVGGFLRAARILVGLVPVLLLGFVPHCSILDPAHHGLVPEVVVAARQLVRGHRLGILP